ncbi:MAG: cyclase family protein [Xanthomonadales bacterium]|nr:cyclase family protein [Xanthomonadales bacterium]
MIATIDWRGRGLTVHLDQGVDLSVTLNPDGPQPSFFAGAPARAEPLKAPGYVGSVAGGGSCNADVLSYVPHCHGTHTECIGHLQARPAMLLDTIDQQPCLAQLVTLQPVSPGATQEYYVEELPAEEQLMTRADLESQIGTDVPSADALVVRTAPNPIQKRSTDYAAAPPYPVFSQQAMQWLSGGHWKHLLIDLPSLDRAHDGGRLVNHRLWWRIDSQEPNPAHKRSVTEMIYVPDELADGIYWLELQLQPLASDAVSSRPILYPADVS